jgi:hypothetical protein
LLLFLPIYQPLAYVLAPSLPCGTEGSALLRVPDRGLEPLLPSQIPHTRSQCAPSLLLIGLRAKALAVPTR